jgi:phospholipid/cholesterol/gamma-HCH transport system substrate-binding protein
MVTKQQKFRLGIFVLMTSILMVLLLSVFLVPKLRSKGNTYYVNFKGVSVNGLYDGSAVKYQGVEIGHVYRITVNPVDLNSILVYVNIKKGFNVTKDMSVTMMYAGITGLKFLELSGGTGTSEILSSGEEIKTGKGLGEKAEDIVSNIDMAVRSINEFLNPDNLDKISLFLDNVEKTSKVFSDVLQGKKASLENSIANMESMMQKFSELTAKLDLIAQNLNLMTQRIQATSEETFASLTKRFSDEELGRVLKNLEEFISTANSGLKKLENVFLLQQEEMRRTFESLGEGLENLSRFSRELTEDPTLLIRSRKEKKK